MFNFRIIRCADGTDIIDRHLKTPYNALTAVQMMEYMEMDNQLAYMDKLECKARKRQNINTKLQRIYFID